MYKIYPFKAPVLCYTKFKNTVPYVKGWLLAASNMRPSLQQKLFITHSKKN